MANLKLERLPDRTPVKVTISVPPELKIALDEYAAAYAQAYGSEEAISELIPAMLASFLEGDRGFQRMRHERAKT
jgi:hypothetical protein